ncbi:glycosyltransferase family 1 protein [Patescibacteria group bacterium]|nr:MAG: glycosyltransferase family 1 protein [Patescibacteria group bacterium]
MRVGIDVRPLMNDVRTGIGEYTHFLLDTIFDIDKKNEYFLFYNSGKDVGANIPQWTQNNIHYVASRWPNKIFNASIKFFNRPRIKEVDIFFSPNLNFTALSPKTKFILTVHDLSFELFPEFFSAKQRLWHKMINPRRQCQRADIIIAPSENTKRDLREIYNIEEKKIKVIYPGICHPDPPQGGEGSLFTAGSIIPPTGVELNCKLAPQPAFGGIMEPANSNPYILFLGTIEPRKNIIGLIEAFEKACPSLPAPYTLVIAGAAGWNNKQIYERAKNSPIKDKIKILGYVRPEEKPALYAGAALFCYPSIYEGFGFPVLEAMSAGTPVLTSNRSSLPEITSGAAHLVNPNNVSDMAAGIINILTNEKLRNFLKEKGQEQAAKFLWQEAAEKFLSVIRSL